LQKQASRKLFASDFANKSANGLFAKEITTARNTLIVGRFFSAQCNGSHRTARLQKRPAILSDHGARLTNQLIH